MKKIAFLAVDRKNLSQEERSAWLFLSRQRGVRARLVQFSTLERNPHLLDDHDLVWWHFDTSIIIPDISIRSNVIESITSFVSDGRGLLLSLLASQ